MVVLVVDQVDAFCAVCGLDAEPLEVLGCLAGVDDADGELVVERERSWIVGVVDDRRENLCAAPDLDVERGRDPG